VVWKEYRQTLDSRLDALHATIHRGSYRARPFRRTYIPKADGTQRGVEFREAMGWTPPHSTASSARLELCSFQSQMGRGRT